MNDRPASHRSVNRRWLLLGACILAIAGLTFASLPQIGNSNRSTAFALQVTTTPVFAPGTTVTPIPGLPVPPSGPALRARQVLEGLLLTLLSFGTLIVAFKRPGAWKLINILGVLLGFMGWFMVNTFLWARVLQNESGVLILNPARLFPLLVNLVLVPVLFRLERWLVLGIVCAILANAIGLLLFPVPTDDIFHRDPTAERIVAMMPFYIPFFFSNA